MVHYLYDFLSTLGVIVLLLVFVFLLLGPAKKFYVVLLYVGWALFSNVALTIADFLYNAPANDTPLGITPGQLTYAHLYWSNDVFLDLLQFLVVIVLTHKATEGGANQKTVGRLLAGVFVAVMLLPFLIFHSTFTPWPEPRWFSGTSQMLNFGAAIMNLVLWGTLIVSKRRDPLVLIVSAGLGVMVAGAAVSYGLRHMIPTGGPKWIPNLFLFLAQIGGWGIWCWAFRPLTKPREAPANALPSH